MNLAKGIGLLCLGCTLIVACSINTTKTKNPLIESYTNLIKQNKGDAETLADTLTSRGNIFLNQNRYDEASADFKQVIRISPLRAFPHAALGDIYREQHLNDFAVVEYTIAMIMEMRTAEIYFYRGLAYLNENKYMEASRDFSLASEIGPDEARFHNNAAASYLNLHDFNDAILESDKALGLQSNLVESLRNRAISYEEIGQHTKAIADYDAAINIDPDDSDTHYNRGVAFMRTNQFDRAIADFGDAIRLKPLNADAYYDRGWIEFHSGSISRSLDDFNKTIEIDPTYGKAYSYLAEIYRCQGYKELARLDLNVATNLNPSSEFVCEIRNSFDDLSTCDLKSNDKDDANQ